MKKIKDYTYDGIFVEHIYNKGQYAATIYFDDYDNSYKIFDDRHYDYYEGRMNEDF